ncbi:MAG: single-stranded DNA-binding protein [Planctomycetia bacterium]|nr:single-stranded DNA-binding protein [Planctomycetia bacterium]
MKQVINDGTGFVNQVLLKGFVSNKLELMQRSNDGTFFTVILLSTSSSENDIQVHRVVVVGDKAKEVVERIKTGNTIFVDGTLHTRAFEDEFYNTRFITEILMLEGRMVDDNTVEA